MSVIVSEGAESVIGLGLVPLLTDKATSEAKVAPEVAVVALDTLHHCIRYDAAPSLAIDTMAALIGA